MTRERGLSIREETGRRTGGCWHLLDREDLLVGVSQLMPNEIESAPPHPMAAFEMEA